MRAKEDGMAEEGSYERRGRIMLETGRDVPQPGHSDYKPEQPGEQTQGARTFEAGMAAERAAIVTWLRTKPSIDAWFDEHTADLIEKGAHLEPYEVVPAGGKSPANPKQGA